LGSYEGERLMWKVASFLVFHKDYSLTFISSDDQEIMLESSGKSTHIVRLTCKEFTWGNHLTQEINQMKIKFEALRKKAKKSKLKVTDIYILPNEPVQFNTDLKDLNLAATGIKTNYCSILLEEPAIKQNLKNVLDDLNINEQEFFNYENIEEDTNVIKDKIVREQQKKTEEIQRVFSYGKPNFTYLFILLNLIFYFLLETYGGSTNTNTLITFGAKFNPYILEGDYWRFITPMFLHIGLTHLIMNTIALFYLGTFVEKMYGSFRFLFIYVIAGFLGTAASFVFNAHISAGASGAIFGCFGALLYFGIMKKELFYKTIGKSILLILAINLLIGFSIPMIDNSAHIGGLVGGFVAATIINLPHHKFHFRQLLFFFTFLLGTVLFITYGFYQQIHFPNPSNAVDEARVQIENDDYETAYKLLSKFKKEKTDLPEVYFLLSYVEIKLAKYDDAVENLQLTIQLNPNFHEAHYNLALLYKDKRKYHLAYESAEEAYKLQPENKTYEKYYHELKKLIK
jgi:rhomboid protease GluP